MKKNETKCAVVESKNERGKEGKSERERERESDPRNEDIKISFLNRVLIHSDRSFLWPP